MSPWIKCLLIFGLFSCTVYAQIVVIGITEEDPAILGSNTTALRCDYDTGNETGVEVKWFFNHNIQIFSWIPMLNEPKAMGKFSQILDVENSTLLFKNITRNLTGVYSCKVSGDHSEDIQNKRMIVHKPPKSTEFLLEEESDSLICACNELFPLPVITLQGHYLSSNKRVPFEKPRTYKTETDDDLFNVSTMSTLNKTEILETTEFVCNIHIPGTTYNETIIYTYNVTSIASDLHLSTGWIVTLAIFTTCRS